MAKSPTPEQIREAVAEKYLRDSDLAERYSVHRNSVWRWVSEGRFPAPVKVGGSTRWRLSEVLAAELNQ